MSLMEKLKQEGVYGLARAAKVNFFWWLEKQILFHAPKLLPLAFRQPRFLYLELTNNCNLNCEMCIRGGGRRIGYMPFDLFTRLIDEAAEIGGVSLSFHFAGEATLHPRFVDCVDYAVQRKRRFYKLSLTTNGTLLKGELAKAALGLDWVTFSVDGVGEVTEKIRLGSNYEIIKENIENFLKLRGKNRKPIVSTNTVISRQTTEQLAEMVVAWKPKGVNVNFSGCIDSFFHIIPNPVYAGFINPKWTKTHSEPVCFMPFSDLLITWDGMAHYCCHNLKGFFPVGSIYTETLMQIWRGQKLQAVRKHLLAGKPEPGEICMVCKKREAT